MKKCKKGLHQYDDDITSGCPECRVLSSRKHHEKRVQQPGYLEYHNKVQTLSYNRNKDLDDNRLLQRGNRLRSRYWPHLNAWQALQEYDRLLADQEYCCKICEVHQDQYKQNLHVDHDHISLEVRGLLCTVCNRYVIGGIDIRHKAKKVHISLDAMLNNIYKYYDYRRKKNG